MTMALLDEQNGLAMMLGSVAVASASPANAMDGSEELDEETKQKITQVWTTSRQRYSRKYDSGLAIRRISPR